MDYLGMAAFACFILGGTLLIGVALYKAHGWWIKRQDQREREATARLEDEYAGLHDALLRHVDELIRKVDRQ